MFTGIVEELGEIKSVEQKLEGLDFCICAQKILEDLKIGDSVAINGCCQTVTSINGSEFIVQAVSETVKLTNFKFLKQGDKVNLERAMMLNSRLGGHLVSGHIEGTGKILSIAKQGNAVIFEIFADTNIMRYIIYKGSVAINGVSLTVCEVTGDSFKVSVIPHTISNTTFQFAKIGGEVNLEPDMLAKYVEKLMIKDDNTHSKITMEFLKENGF